VEGIISSYIPGAQAPNLTTLINERLQDILRRHLHGLEGASSKVPADSPPHQLSHPFNTSELLNPDVSELCPEWGPSFFLDQYPEAQQGLGLMVGQADFFHMVEPASAETSQVTSVQSPLYDSAPQLFEHSILDTPDPGRGNPVNNAFGSSPPAW